MSDESCYEITVKDYGKGHVSFGIFKGEETARELTRKLIDLISVEEVNCSLYAAVPASRC